MSDGKLRIYGCGGAGINISKMFKDMNDIPAAATITPTYIDSSMSNVSDDINPKDTFILENVDGSGKVRKENSTEIQAVIKKILNAHKPHDMNVVVFSASGGSGSVFGPLIMSELMERGETVVGVVIGSHESNISTTNTLKTLKTLESIAGLRKRPAVVFYEQLSGSRGACDEQVKLAISALSVMASKKNLELDSKDIFNWVNYDRVTDLEPRLSLLDIVLDTDESLFTDAPISVLSILNDTNSKLLSAPTDYMAVGYLPPDNCAGLNFKDIHFIISTDNVSDVMSGLNKIKVEHDERNRNRNITESIVGKDDEVSSSGLVL